MTVKPHTPLGRLKGMSGTGAPGFVNSVELSVISYATEDEERVERALRNLMPPEFDAKVTRQRLKGYYNDPITRILVKVTKRKEASRVMRQVVGLISTLDQSKLLDEIEKRTDDAGSLYLRFEKQRALSGVAVLNDYDPVRVKIKFYVPHGEETDTFIRSVLEEGFSEATASGGSSEN
jgi:RNA binding exosome subunit